MSPIQFGILMVPYQAIDTVGPLDILSSSSKDMIKSLEDNGFPGTAGVSEKAVDIQFHHINDTLDPVTLTSAVRVLPSTTVDDCPPLDYLLIGGPDPKAYTMSDKFVDFVRDHVEAGKGLFTTCTGAATIAPFGILDGKKATTNHLYLDTAAKMSPGVKWTNERWVVDGNIWTAGGACAGMDMMAHWLVQNYGIEVARLGFLELDYAPRGLDGKVATFH